MWLLELHTVFAVCAFKFTYKQGMFHISLLEERHNFSVEICSRKEHTLSDITQGAADKSTSLNMEFHLKEMS